MPLPNAVATPIVNDPFTAPTRYYDFSSGTPQLLNGRRLAGYLRGDKAQVRLIVSADRWKHAINYAGTFGL